MAQKLADSGLPSRAGRWILVSLAALVLALSALAFVLGRRPPRLAQADALAGTEAAPPSVALERAAQAAKPTTGRREPPPSFDERDYLRRRVGELESEVQDLKRGATSSQEKPPGTDPRCAYTISEECPAFPASREILAARARCGTLLFDAPGFLGNEDDTERPTSNPDEAAGVKLARDFKAEVFQELDGIYRELSGAAYRPPSTIAQLRPKVEALTEAVAADVRRLLAEELAGLRPPPTPAQLRSRPPAERYWRLWAGLGDRYEKRAAEVFGSQAARDARVNAGGWKNRNMYMGQCPDEAR
jgi:hypothetical protein